MNNNSDIYVPATLKSFSWYQNNNKIYITACSNKEVSRGNRILLKDCDVFHVTCVANNYAREIFSKILRTVSTNILIKITGEGNTTEKFGKKYLQFEGEPVSDTFRKRLERGQSEIYNVGVGGSVCEERDFSDTQ